MIPFPAASPAAPELDLDAILEEAQQELSKAKILMMSLSDFTFFTTVTLSLKQKWDLSIPTAATDGLRLLINPIFFLSLERDEQVFLLFHETLHVAYQHALRLDSRDPEKWNHAADYVINGILVERGLKIPQGGLHDSQYSNLSSDAVYELIEDPPKGRCMDLQKPCTNGEGGNKDDKTAREHVKAQIDDLLVRAALQNQMSAKPGMIPAELERYINKLTNPKLPWNQILRKFMNGFAKNDYNWRRPNRRFFPDYILPSLYSENLDTIAVAIDTSGSISDDQFQHFCDEVYGILTNLRPKEIRLLQFSCGIVGNDLVKTQQDFMNVQMAGRGGTDVTEVIEWADETKPVCLIIFTDGYLSIPEPPKGVPVIWIIHSHQGDFEAPYGKIINYELPEDIR